MGKAILSPGQPPDFLTRGRLRVLVSLGYRDYRLFWLGAVFSNLGIWALMAGRLWLVYTLTESTLMLGLVTFSGLGPILLLSVWGGVVADRVNRLRLVTVSRAIFSVLAFLTAALIYFEVVQAWHVIAISLATGILVSFDIPSRQAIVPNLVSKEHLLNAIVLYAFLMSGAAVIAPSFFAPMVNLWGLAGLFTFVGVAYALTVAMLLMMGPEQRRTGTGKVKLLEDLAEGFSYIRHQRVVLGLIGVAIVGGIFGSSFGTLLPVFADEILRGGVNSYAYLLLSQGIGALAGIVLLALFGSQKTSEPLQLATGVGFGVALAVFARISWLPASIGVMGIMGAFSMVFMTINNSLLQSIVADEFRGRVMSIHQLGWGASAIGGLLMGWVAHIVDVPFTLTASGLITAAATAIILTTVVRRRPGERLAAEDRASGRAEASTGH